MLYHQRLIDNVPIEAVVKRYNAAPVFARKRFVNQRIAVIFGNAGHAPWRNHQAIAPRLRGDG